MITLEDLQAQITALQAEVARLRDDAAQFFRVMREDDGSICETQLHCTMLQVQTIIIQNDKKQIRSMISVDEFGPFHSMWGDDGKARLIMRVCENNGRIDIYDPEFHPVVQLYRSDEGHGHVGVLSDKGVPRAIIKGMDTGGVFSAVSPEGKPRAIMHSFDDKGELAIIQDQQIVVKVASGPGGGMLVTFNNNGTKSCVIISTDLINSLLLNGPDGKPAVSLVGGPTGNGFTVGQVGEEDNLKPVAELFDLPGLGADFVLRDEKGKVAVQIGAVGGNGEVTVTGATPESHVKMHILNEGGTVSVARAGTPHSASMSAAPTGGIVVARGKDDAAVALTVTDAGGSLSVNKGKHVQVFAGVTANGTNGTVMVTNPDQSPAVQIVAGDEGGTVLVNGNDGLIQMGCKSTDAGGQLTIFSELAVERATISSRSDGGGLHLKWGGTTGVIAAATERGGVILTHGADGNVVATMPEHGWTEEEEPESGD